MAAVETDQARSASGLTPYLPRVTLEWIRDNEGARFRVLEGSLLFFDVSGFTRMSERLAQAGKAGAEEVTGVMNATFAALLEVAYANGGSLLKFGGDALLLFFDGDEHAPRAASAAHGMRATLRRIGRPRTSAGTVALRMHAGLHSGEIAFFLVGESHRELIVSGPAATRTVELESAAVAGEILVSAETEAALPAAALGETKGGGRLLRGDPRPAPRPEALPDVTGLELEQYVPGPVRDVLAAGAVEPEHRQATVGFLHFGGVDRLEPEAAAEALDELVRATQAAADEHGVCFLESDIDGDGGKIVLVSGAPQASENDEERLLRAARAVADAGVRLPVRLGINRGRVFAGEVGAEFRKTYTILGETAALAARLMSRAEPGQILTTRELLERSRTRFEVREVAPFVPKGSSRAMVPLAVGAVAGSREREQRQLPLVGRRRELAVLSAALAPVRMGFGTLVELVGEPGIGKSRLVEELRAQAADLAAYATACEQYESSTPYFAFRELLRALLAVDLDGRPASNSERLRERIEPLAAELVPWIPLLAIPLDVDVTPTREVDELQPAFRRARLHGVVATLLEKLLPDPTLLLFEDVHWMDEASSELLRHLAAQALASHPWFACATRRAVPGGFSAAEGTPPVPALTIRLDPLPAEDAKALVVSAAGEQLLGHEIEAITDRAGGNPLFLQELVATSSAAAVEEELPETVEAVVAARIDRLAPADRTLLRWASVLGQAFLGDVILAVLEDDPGAAADSEAWDRLAEFVERDPDVPGGFRFRHALIRDAAYEGLSFRRRRELHARVAEVYERLYGDQAVEYAELLALHFLRAGIYEKAWTYALAAGERAQAKFANVEAAGFYRRALEAARKLPQLDPAAVARAWEALGDVAQLAGLYSDAETAFRNARKQVVKGSGDEVSLLLKEGLIRERSGRYAEALRWYARGLRAADALPPGSERTVHRVELGLAHGAARFRQGRFADCIDWCRRVVEQASEIEYLPGLAHAYFLLHVSYTELGSPDRVAFRGLALPIYEELGDLLGQAQVLNNLGIDAYYEGRWDDALDLYRRSREARDRIGDVVGAASVTNNIGEIKSDQGHLDAAEQLFVEVHAVTDAAGNRFLATLATSNLGRVAARGGRLEDARRLLQEALGGFEEIGSGGFVLETEARLAEVDLFAGEHREALTRAEATLARMEAGGASAVLAAALHRIRGGALRLAGDAEGARAALYASLALSRSLAADYETALTLSELARLDGSVEHAQEAAAILERLGVVSPKSGSDTV